MKSNISYLVKDMYFNGEYKIINNKNITLNFINRFSMIQEMEEEFRSNKINIVKLEKADIDFTYYYSKELTEDGYKIEITENEIKLYGKNRRSFMYGQRVIEEIMIFEDNEILLPICEIKDEPTFKIRGIIEGFYGIPWSVEDRKHAIEVLNKNRMNAYMYAPKDDVYHRDKWRETYPEDIFSQIKDVKDYCDEKLVDFYYCISPGKDIDVTKEEDINLIEDKLKAMIEIGVKDFALLLDDIDYTLKGNHKNKFRTIGKVHSYISNRVYDFLEKSLTEFNMIMCPSEYWQNYNTLYRDDLKESLNENISVFWTGYNTIAKNITEEDCKITSENINRDLVLWDNIPVNDLDVKNIFLSPVKNRFRNMDKYNHIGIVANPMTQFNLSKVTLISYSHFMWNPNRYCEDISLELACKEIDLNHYKELINFSKLNGNSRIENIYDRRLEKAINNLDFNVLDKYYEEMKKILDGISSIEDKGFYNEAKPWIERGRKDINEYEKIKENLEYSKKVAEEIKEEKHKIGPDILMKLIEKIINTKEEENEKDSLYTIR